ncbi:MAG: hypothetical protein GF311_28175 [Candidatus Lokiarchaeota archaeon]|nr:hypothetical protein [Candidatus Lokiarchaeota archaeon]
MMTTLKKLIEDHGLTFVKRGKLCYIFSGESSLKNAKINSILKEAGANYDIESSEGKITLVLKECRTGATICSGNV